MLGQSVLVYLVQWNGINRFCFVDLVLIIGLENSKPKTLGVVGLNFDMADVILEWTLDVSRYANTFILRGEIIIFRGESVRPK